MENQAGRIIGPMRPVAFLILGYLIETTDKVGKPEIWVNMKDISATLNGYVNKRSIPVNLTPGHMKAVLLMLEGGYVFIERDSREEGRNLHHPFKVRVNPSAREIYKELEEQAGYSLKGISGS